MPSPEFVDATLAIVARIPAGRVMTYGDVALAIGSNAPRAVGRVLALYGHGTHWWRVVPASGQPPQGHASLALPDTARRALRCDTRRPPTIGSPSRRPGCPTRTKSTRR
ncbi:MGMT family protein [Leucobacter luti]|uniref:MGMT family protein n=1 Tax=Leucobacter luti TaxID=340320 RepID=UPI001C693CB1|nr:MGMT family protein [Leucobacter luti]QYM75369.1 MGMT family protein [Leucobacter luti]